jgi:hypothetical protein
LDAKLLNLSLEKKHHKIGQELHQAFALNCCKAKNKKPSLWAQLYTKAHNSSLGLHG